MCAWGTTIDVDVRIPADLAAEGVARVKRKPIDACVAPIVVALQAAGIDMRSSCCGHGRGDGEILLQDGRVLVLRAAAERTTGAPHAD